MNEQQDVQQNVTDLLLIENGLKLLQEKIKKQILSIPYLKESNAEKLVMKESFEASQNRTIKLLQKTRQDILNA